MTPGSHRVAHLDELESIPGPGTLTWRPVRAHFDIRAFGCNAYRAEGAGEDVVEPHDEADPNDPPGHQELYFVHEGSARFTIDGETFDAPQGTYVWLPDPASHRHAVAREAGTTVLSFGGPPRFEPSGWEWSFRAAPLIPTEPVRAREILEDGLAQRPENAGIRFRLACLEAVEGNTDAALARLRESIERNREAADAAREEPLLEPLRDSPEFRSLVAPG
ncbi:MAG TPA: tetratricopeptide repeat protein [Solirubrobacterales bacterium]|nr:tetratricopeptide repeat protein [Solirubrobacterales bacterium]